MMPMIHIDPKQPISYTIPDNLSYPKLLEFEKGLDKLMVPFVYNWDESITIFCRDGMKQAFEVYSLIDKIKNNKL